MCITYTIFTLGYIYNVKRMRPKNCNYKYFDNTHRLFVQTPAMICLYLILNY